MSEITRRNFLKTTGSKPLAQNHWLKTTASKPLAQNHCLKTTGSTALTASLAATRSFRRQGRQGGSHGRWRDE